MIAKKKDEIIKGLKNLLKLIPLLKIAIISELLAILLVKKTTEININNGERLETYVIEGSKGSGEVSINGPAARKVEKGYVIIVISYDQIDKKSAKSFRPTIIFPNE